MDSSLLPPRCSTSFPALSLPCIDAPAESGVCVLWGGGGKIIVASEIFSPVVRLFSAFRSLDCTCLVRYLLPDCPPCCQPILPQTPHAHHDRGCLLRYFLALPSWHCPTLLILTCPPSHQSTKSSRSVHQAPNPCSAGAFNDDNPFAALLFSDFFFATRRSREKLSQIGLMKFSWRFLGSIMQASSTSCDSLRTLMRVPSRFQGIALMRVSRWVAIVIPP